MVGGEKVFDVTDYIRSHPGGPMRLLDLKGRPLMAEREFVEIGHGRAARRHMRRFYIGDLEKDDAYYEAKRELEEKEG